MQVEKKLYFLLQDLLHKEQDQVLTLYMVNLLQGSVVACIIRFLGY